MSKDLDNVVDVEESYEASKGSYQVMESYDVPKWYKNHIWMWPILILYLFIVTSAVPEGRTFAIVSWGLVIVVLDIMAILVRRNWPM